MTDSFGLQRFVDAQAGVYESALAELRAGKKRGHWMWFVFPQLRGLGRSDLAQYYGIASHGEAVAYCRHALLGVRLRQCTGATLPLAQAGRSARSIFGTPDDLKFRSSLTLFAEVACEEPAFQEALARFFDGEPDPTTIKLLAGH